MYGDAERREHWILTWLQRDVGSEWVVGLRNEAGLVGLDQRNEDTYCCTEL